MIYVWIGVFGLVGTFARYGLQGLVQEHAAAGFPWGTLVVNVVGSFLVGLIARLGTGSTIMSPDLRAGLLVGLCGGFTTFSSYSYETLRLLQEGAWPRALLYGAGSVVISLAATLGGIEAAARLL